jgi:hypothetical protein
MRAAERGARDLPISKQETSVLKRNLCQKGDPVKRHLPASRGEIALTRQIDTFAKTDSPHCEQECTPKSSRRGNRTWFVDTPFVVACSKVVSLLRPGSSRSSQAADSIQSFLTRPSESPLARGKALPGLRETQLRGAWLRFVDKVRDPLCTQIVANCCVFINKVANVPS